MADYVEIDGKLITLPRECEHDMAARAAFIEKVAVPPAKQPAPKREEK
jgi:hypothetical protein